jgi:cytochrome c oxidase subunit 1
MPRRIYTYGPQMGWGALNLIATLGSALAVAGGLVMVANGLLSLRFGRKAGADPWEAPTLEWACESPPPCYNFDYTPVVESLVPLWRRDPLPVMDGMALDARALLVTSVVEAVPEYRQNSVGPSIWPLVAALAVSAMFIGSIFTAWAVVIGVVPIGIALTIWFWPKRERATSGPLARRTE